jgi:NAD(P)-dependent dehydrogenase (short-subunit alcohol dehydrogenase family)
VGNVTNFAVNTSINAVKETSMAKRKLAVITGGASGLGEATARRFASEGYDVAVIDMNDKLGESLATSLMTGACKAQFFKCDVSDQSAVDTVAARVTKEMGVADALITCAGLIPNTESVMDMDMVAHERMWAVNYHGTVHACRSFGRPMIECKRGSIVTIGSINSVMPLPLPAYNPGKAAVERLTQLLCVELGRHNIRVNSIAPTYVMTPPLKAKVAAGERDMKKIMGVHALPSLPDPADIANAIAFLCSEQARCITGVLLPVDSGWLSAVTYRTYAGGVPWQE